MTEPTVVELRCSNLPLFMLCAPSHLHPEPENNEPPTRPAKLGLDSHAMLRQHVEGQEVEEAEDGELAALFAYGRKGWEVVKHEFPDPQAEIYNDYFGGGFDNSWLLTGHVDVFSLGHILDWKSGRVEDDYTAQMKGYGLVFGATHGVIVWLRDQKLEQVDVSDHAGFEREITKQVERIWGKPNPGKHCFHCYGSKEKCPGYLAWAHSTVGPFLPAVQKPQQPGAAGQGAPDLPTTDAGRWAFHDAARHVKQIIARGDVLLKSYLQANGPMRSADGRVMTYDEEETAGPIDCEKAWPYLIDRFDQKEMQKFVVLHKGNLEAAVKKDAPKGEKGKAWFAFKDELKEAGAMPNVVKRRLKVKREKP